MTTNETATVTPRRELAIPGGGITFLAMGEDTKGVFSLMRETLPAKMMGAVPHYHEKTSEAFYVLSGELTLLVGDEWVKVGPGEMKATTPGMIHGFRNDGDEPVTFLGFATPSGLEGLLTEMLEYIKSSPTWPPADRSEIIAIGKRYDTYYLRS